MSLTRLRKEIEQLNLSCSSELTILRLFEILRYNYCQKYLTDMSNLLAKADIKVPIKNSSPKQEKYLHNILNSRDMNWENTFFHLKYRVQEPDDLIDLRPDIETYKEKIMNIIGSKGY